MSKVSFEDVFGEDEDLYEIINMIRFDDFDEATNVKDELNYNMGWYNYSTVTFDYEGKRYSVEYKEHTSDNLTDMEYFHDTFVCLGDATEMDKKVSREDLERMKFDYERRINKLENKLKRNQEELKILNLLKPLSYENLKFLSELFSADKPRKQHFIEKVLEEFFIELSKRK